MKDYKTQINGLGNTHDVLEKQDFSISYAYTGNTGSFAGDDDYETAIVTNKGYYILNGDHREEYSKCKTLAHAMKYFKSKPELKSSWSN